MFTATVAPCRLACVHRRDEPPGERHCEIGLIGRHRGVYHLRSCQHVAGNRKTGADLMAAPVDAGRAGEGGKAPVAVHDVKLPVLRTRIRRGQEFDGVLGRGPGLQQGKRLRTIVGVDESLRGNRADSRFDMGYHGADGEEAGRHDDPDPAGCLIPGDDRPRHGFGLDLKSAQRRSTMPSPANADKRERASGIRSLHLSP